MSFKPLYSLAPNGTPILRPSDFSPMGMFGPRANKLTFSPDQIAAQLSRQELAADYAAPVVGSAPPGLGFNFGDSFRRTGRGTMEFSLPTGQEATINESLRWAAENVFVGKAMRLKTDFTCKGLRNATADDTTNKFLDNVLSKLKLHSTYRLGVWLYYTAGLVPIIFNEPDKPLSYAEIWDPRNILVNTWYGKTYAYLKPDERMIAAVKDPKGTANPFNKDYFNALPAEWKKQIEQQINKVGGSPEKLLIKLTPGSYSIIENRATRFNRFPGTWDGAPLQPYFSACQVYRQLMSGDFAASFLAKNLLALVSVGDPKAEGENYQRPDNTVLAMLQAALQNPAQAQWLYGDPTFNIRYITPEVDTFTSSKYDEVRGQLQELLPSCFWNGEEGSFANSAVSLKALQEEVDACNLAFDQQLFQPLFERATERNPRVAKKDVSAPQHDHNSLEDSFAWLTAQSNLYNNGGLSIRSLVEAHGYDYDVEKQRLTDQQKDIKKGIFMPAFESKQGIVVGKLDKDGVIPPTTTIDKVPSSKGLMGGSTPVGTLADGSTLHVQPPAAAATKTTSAKRTRSKRGSAKATAKANGRPSKPNSRPQPETNNTRAPRPQTKS